MFMNAFITAFRLDIFYHIWYNKVKSKNKKGENKKLTKLF